MADEDGGLMEGEELKPVEGQASIDDLKALNRLKVIDITVFNKEEVSVGDAIIFESVEETLEEGYLGWRSSFGIITQLGRESIDVVYIDGMNASKTIHIKDLEEGTVIIKEHLQLSKR